MRILEGNTVEDKKTFEMLKLISISPSIYNGMMTVL